MTVKIGYYTSSKELQLLWVVNCAQAGLQFGVAWKLVLPTYRFNDNIVVQPAHQKLKRFDPSTSKNNYFIYCSKLIRLREAYGMGGYGKS